MNQGLRKDACPPQPPQPDRTNRPVAVGARILIPGYPQWSWDQRERALFLFGSFATSLLVGVLTWGTAVGLGIFAFAFVTHVYSAVDAIRQNSFPGFGRLVPTLTASAGLGTFCYLPALAMASVYAWPIALEERPREGYLVNRWAYRHDSPRAGETVWLGSKRGFRPKVGRVVAGPGQRVEWVANQFRVDDEIVEDSPFLGAESPAELKLTIPERHALVVFRAGTGRGNDSIAGWEIIESADIRGRAWAQSYPYWERGLVR